jgi:hypothetical protein
MTPQDKKFLKSQDVIFYETNFDAFEEGEEGSDSWDKFLIFDEEVDLSLKAICVEQKSAKIQKHNLVAPSLFLVDIQRTL